MTLVGDRIDFDAESRVTGLPLAGESVGWVIEQAGTELFMFLSGCPHPEGTKNPIQRFESTMDLSDEPVIDSIFRANFGALYRRNVPVG